MTPMIFSSYVNPFSAELFKVDSFMFKLGQLYFHDIGFLEYFYNSQPNNADFRWDSSLRADSHESALFAKCSILPLALKELKELVRLQNAWAKWPQISQGSCSVWSLDCPYWFWGLPVKCRGHSIFEQKEHLWFKYFTTINLRNILSGIGVVSKWCRR